MLKSDENNSKKVNGVPSTGTYNPAIKSFSQVIRRNPYADKQVKVFSLAPFVSLGSMRILKS